MKTFHSIWLGLVVLLLISGPAQVFATEPVTGRILAVEINAQKSEADGQVLTLVVDVLTHGESALPSADPNHLAGKIIITECSTSSTNQEGNKLIRQAATMMKAYVEHEWRTIVDMEIVPKPPITGIPTFNLKKLILPTPNNYSQMVFNCE